MDAWVALLGLVALGLVALVFLLFRRRAAGGVVDSAHLVELVRAAVEAQVRATTTDTMEATGRQTDELLSKRGEVLAAQTKGLLDPLAQQLQVLQQTVGELRSTFETNNGAVTSMSEQLLIQIGSLSGVTSQLAGALRSPAARGAWGENQLRNIIELAGMTNYCDFSEQSTVASANGLQRPDLTVRLPNGAFLVVDSKVPLAAYLEMQAAADEAMRSAKLNDHVRATRAHVRTLADKRYWEQFPESPDFVVMFVPGESFLADALRAEASLVDDAMRSRVVITSPMSLMALLLTVARGWQTRQMTESASRIATEAADLLSRMDVALGHVTRTGRHIDQTAASYNELVGSLERRVLPSLRRMRDLGVPAEELVEPVPLEAVTRQLNVPELAAPDHADTEPDLAEDPDA